MILFIIFIFFFYSVYRKQPLILVLKTFPLICFVLQLTHLISFKNFTINLHFISESFKEISEKNISFHHSIVAAHQNHHVWISNK